MGFQNEEKRRASFKHVFNKLQTSVGTDLSGELFETAHQIYSNELLSAELTFSSAQPSNSGSTRTWTKSGATSTAVSLWDDGSFTTVENSSGDSNFEYIAVPLVKLNGSQGQGYIAHIKDSPNTNGIDTEGNVSNAPSARLKNWINPSRYGAGYKVAIYPSKADFTGPDSTPVDDYDNGAGTHGGWAFDYYQGLLYIAKKSDDSFPDLSTIRHPLWAVGYRYTGATGSAAAGTTTGGTGGISEITSTTPTNLSFDSETSTITIGEDSTAIGVGSLSPYKRAYYNHDFARNDIRNYSSILINSTSSATGAPYTDGADNQLIIPVIHMPIGFGFSIGFTSSNFESANLSGYKYFEHTKADKWDYHATHTSSDWLDLQYTDGANGNIPFNVRTFNQSQPEFSGTKAVYRGWYKGESGNRLEFDITSKSKFEIADGLRSLINTSKCYQHVSASIHQEGSDWRLKVEQVYSGYPYASYSIKYVGSSTGPNMQPSTHSLVSSHWNTGNGKAQNLWQPEHMNQSSDFTTNVVGLAIGDKVGYLGALGFSTTTDINFSMMMSPGAGNTPVKLIEPNNNSAAWTCISDVTGSGYPYGTDVTLINGEVGQQNPTARSILKIHEKLVKNDLYRVGSHYFGYSQFNSDGSLNQTIRDNYIAIMNDNNGFTDYVYSGDTPFIQFSDAVAAQKNTISWPIYDIGNIIKSSYTAELYDNPFYNYTGIDVTTTNPGNTQFNIIIADLTDLDTRFTGSFYLSSSTSGTSSLPAPTILQTLRYEFTYTGSIADTWNLYYPKKAFTGTYTKNSTNGSKDLLTYFPQTYNYIDPDKLALNSAGAMQTITSPLKIIGDVEIVGTLSASVYQGVTGGSGGGTDNLGNHTATASLDMSTNAIINVTTISASSYISASSFIGDGSQLTGIAAAGDYIVSNQTASVTNLTATGNAILGDSDTDNHSIVGNLKTGPAIIGISGSEKQAYNDTKLDDFFKGPGESHYSLYVRNGATIIGGDIIPDRPKYHSLGSKRFPFKDLHVARGSVIFYSASADNSGSDAIEHARMSVNTSSGDVEFTSGSELKKLHVKEIGVGGVLGSSVGSVQIGTQTQGFIAVNADEQGNRSTILRAESTVLSGDSIMGSITQKGSGSFAILLDADGAKPGAKFVIESNTASPGYGARLFSVSESMETRVYGNLKVDTHITASGNISASGDLMFNKIDGGTF